MFTALSNRGQALDSSLEYRFTVSAINFNGEGPASDISVLHSCTYPSGLEKPNITFVSSALVSIEWSAPESSGGCQLKSYHVFIKALVDSTWTELTAAANLPYLRVLDIDMTLYPVAADYQVRLSVENAVGAVYSDSVVFLLADVPD